MYHFIMDVFNGYRSRLDDVLLVNEVLEEIPLKLGIKTVMPPFILPYYNGVVPEDCGISAFVFLAGGHFTLHTFSYREAYFVDLLSPEPIDVARLEQLIKEAFPAGRVTSYLLQREKPSTYPQKIEINQSLDFGPHLFLDFDHYVGPKTMDDLFELFDTMPYRIGMTPIIRPYAMKNTVNGEKVTSILTMIAESHISLHYFEESQKAYMDLFSCRFFDTAEVIPTLKQIFGGHVNNEVLMARGSKYQQFKTDSKVRANKSRVWLDNVYQR